MAYGLEYLSYFKDNQQINTYKIELLKDGFTDPSTAIVDLKLNSISINYQGKKGDNAIIKGTSFSISFLADSSNLYDSIFESNYKDYKLNYINDDSSSLIWTGYIKPDNLTRNYLGNKYFINLNAIDGLADLKNIDFKSIQGRGLNNRYTILEIIKEAVSLTDIELDFKIQLNTYEAEWMNSDECALNKTSIQTRRFWTSKDGKIKYYNAYDVLEGVLKPFNAQIKQLNGYYNISTIFEPTSYLYEYNYSTLTEQSRTSYDVSINIDDYKFSTTSNLYKIQPLKQITTTLNNQNLGGTLVPNLDNWGVPETPTPWTLSFDSLTSESNGQVTLNSNSTTSDCYVELTSPFSCSYGDGSTNLYINIDFEIEMTDFLDTYGDEPPTAFNIFQVEITRPDSTVKTIGPFKLNKNIPYFFNPTTNDALKVVEGGDYSLKINFLRTTSNWSRIEFKIQNVAISEVNYIAGSDTNNVVYDIDYITQLNQGIVEIEDKLTFGDTESITDIASFTIDSLGIPQATANWNRYDSSDGKYIQYLYNYNILKNRQRFKNYIKLSIDDPSLNINLNSIINMDSKQFEIHSFHKNYQNNFIDVDLQEIIIEDVSLNSENVDSLTSIDGTNTDAVTYVESGSLTAHSALTGLNNDDHNEIYQNKTNLDASFGLYYPKTNLQTSGQSSVHWDNLTNVPTYDNYQYWNLKTDSVLREQINSGGILDIIGGSNISVGYAAGGMVTIDAAGGGTVTNVSGTAPITSSGGNTPAIGLDYEATIFEIDIQNELNIKSGGLSNNLMTETYYIINTNDMDDIGDGANYVKTENNFTDTLLNKLNGVATSADNYQYWNLRTDSVLREQINSGGILDIIGGSNISVGYAAGGQVTINNSASGTVTSVTGTTPITSTGGATPAIGLDYEPTIFEIDIQNELNIKSGGLSDNLMASNYYIIGTNDMDDITNSVTYVKTENNFTDTLLNKLNGVATSADNYQYWNLKTDSVLREQINSGAILNIIGGTNISVGYAAGGAVTINSSAGGGTVTNVSGTAPITSSGGATPDIGLTYDNTQFETTLAAKLGMLFGTTAGIAAEGDHTHSTYLLKAGGTMSGTLKIPDDKYLEFGDSTKGVREYSDGTYFRFSKGGATSGLNFYITDEIPITYIYSPAIYLGYNSGTNIYLRNNILFLTNIKANDTNGIKFYENGGTEYWRMADNGDFHAEGDIIAQSTTVSDIKLKKNIVPIQNALNKITSLNGVEFNYKKKDEILHNGIIAQELEKIIPNVVYDKKLPLIKDDGEKYKTVNYIELIPYLVEAIKELKLEIEILKNK